MQTEFRVTLEEYMLASDTYILSATSDTYAPIEVMLNFNEQIWSVQNHSDANLNDYVQQAQILLAVVQAFRAQTDSEEFQPERIEPFTVQVNLCPFS